jgi:prepilin-type N-terminal cleavage/methylation domain-containing protein
MKKSKNKNKVVQPSDWPKRGFTLVETIVVIFIFTILALGATTLFTHIFISSRDKLYSMDNIDYARMVATNFTNEIRVASVGSTGTYPLNQADNSQIIFYSNYKQSPGIVARIRYYLTGSALYKGVVIPSGSPLSYNLALEKIQKVQDNIMNTGQPLFYYYDGNYNGSSTPFTQPINVNLVKYVRINLDIFTQGNTTATTTFNVSAGASIRNLKTNLGN